MRILFLDDNLDRHDAFRRNTIGLNVDHVYTAQEAIEKLDDGEVSYDVIFLDHDLNHETENQLNDDEEDGRLVAKRLATIDRYRNTTIILHSLNEMGRISMKAILDDALFNVVVIMPFAWLYFKQDANGDWVLDPNL